MNRRADSPQFAWRTLARTGQAVRDGAVTEVRLERGGRIRRRAARRQRAAGDRGLWGTARRRLISGLAALEDWEDLGGGKWRAALRAMHCDAEPGDARRRDAAAGALAEPRRGGLGVPLHRIGRG